MKGISKKYYIKETELCILLALKGKQSLYGIKLDNSLPMSLETLHHNLFLMQKKGVMGKREIGDFWIDKELDNCVELIQTAELFIVLADRDEMIPEQYFYIAGDNVVMLEPTGAVSEQHSSAFHMEQISKDEMRNIFKENGFYENKSGEEIPPDICDKAREYMHEDKDTILQYPMVGKLIQEYDVRTQCRIRQFIKFICGVDEYIVCSGNWEGDMKL